LYDSCPLSGKALKNLLNLLNDLLQELHVLD
jgi:hypothetical protein